MRAACDCSRPAVRYETYIPSTKRNQIARYNGNNGGVLVICPRLTSYLTLAEWRKCLLVCKEWYSSLRAVECVRAMIRPGDIVPEEYRDVLWSAALGDPSIYPTAASFERCKLHAGSYNRNPEEIRKDTGRTFTQFPQFDVLMQMKLEDALATALFKAPKPTDYCQGMNYIAAFFLYVTRGHTKKASEMMYQWLFKNGNILRFESGFKTVRQECEILFRFANLYTPTICNQLKRYGFDLQLFSFSWHLLLYVYEVQQDPSLINVLLAIWDQILIQDDYQYLIKTSAFILTYAENLLLSEDGAKLHDEEFMCILKNMPNQVFQRYSSKPEILVWEISQISLPNDPLLSRPVAPGGFIPFCNPRSTSVLVNSRDTHDADWDPNNDPNQHRSMHSGRTVRLAHARPHARHTDPPND